MTNAHRTIGTVLAVGLWVTLSGCVVTDIGVSNPLPEVRRVAVAPFINLSTEPDVDLVREAAFGGAYSDRRFALAYYAELQKIPGYEVIPVGVVDQAIAASERPMNGPDDYLAIARAIGADAIVVGAVTDYDPYHPRLGLQIQWYALDNTPPPAATQPWEREWDEESYRGPEEPSHRDQRRERRQQRKHRKGCQCEDCADGACEVVRAQSLDEETPNEFMTEDASPLVPPQLVQATPLPMPPPGGVPLGPIPSTRTPLAYPVDPELHSFNSVMTTEILPLYSYTRFFDGRDARLTARLRDYVELSGDTRAGGWKSYLTRSDDFIRFSCHVVIQEMLMLHGGESSRRVVFKHRKQLSRKL